MWEYEFYGNRMSVLVNPMTVRVPKHDLPLICGSQSFPVKKTLLMEKSGLFLENPELL
jgi:hypothetical protein